MATIAIEEIKINAHHGVYEIEKERGNSFVVDVYLETDIEQAASSDSLQDTLDYQAIYNLVLAEMKIRANLLETLVCRIGKHILSAYPQVEQVRLRISKLQPLHLEACMRTYVDMTFDRSYAPPNQHPAHMAQRKPG